MKLVARLLLTLGLLCAALTPLLAADGAGLFINLISDDAHRAQMALSFGGNQLERGHPLTVFLNDRGVNLAAKANTASFGEQQQQLAALLEKGATLIVCPLCMKHYGVDAADLIPGAVVGNPDLTGAALFAEDTRSLTW